MKTRFRPCVEKLENRIVLSGVANLSGEVDQFIPLVMAGTSSHSEADSPEARASLANGDSRLGSVGSLFLRQGNGPRGSLCTAAPIKTALNGDVKNILLTAGHCVDNDDNGIADYQPSRVTFYPGGDTSAGISAKRIQAHPDFKGFSNAITDDIALIELSSDLPQGVDVYDLKVATGTGTRVILAGFGGSGYGDVGQTVNGNLSVMRKGENVIDLIVDNGELWEADFDGPAGTGTVGGVSLGNRIESIQAPGDSGGPIFYDDNGTLKVAGTMTYGQNTNLAPFPKFGSEAGGMLISNAYVSWIDEFIGGGGGGDNGDDGTGDGGKRCHPRRGCTSASAFIEGDLVVMMIEESPATPAEEPLVQQREEPEEATFMIQPTFTAPTSTDRPEHQSASESTHSLEGLWQTWPDEFNSLKIEDWLVD